MGDPADVGKLKNKFAETWECNILGLTVEISLYQKGWCYPQLRPSYFNDGGTDYG